MPGHLGECSTYVQPTMVPNEIAGQHEGKGVARSPGSGSEYLTTHTLSLPDPPASSHSETWAWEAEISPALTPPQPADTQVGHMQPVTRQQRQLEVLIPTWAPMLAQNQLQAAQASLADGQPARLKGFAS